MTRAILDTSVLIGWTPEEDVHAMAEELSFSVITLAELELGVLLATDPNNRARRLSTLTRAHTLGAPLGVDRRAASAYAALAASVMNAGKRPRINDTWIAATALAHEAEVWTRDGDFSDFKGRVRVVRL